MSKKSNKKSAKTTTTQQRPAKRKKIVSLAQYEADIKTTKGAAPDAHVAPQAENAVQAEPTAKEKKERKPGAPRKSLTNAAILVLAHSSGPMNAKAIVDAATTSGWYTPTAGKTPHATLYSAMLIEARDDGDKARFRKADRGLWELTDAGKAQVDAIQEVFAGKEVR